MQVPFLDLKKINTRLSGEIQKKIDSVINNGWYIRGDYCQQFEKFFFRLLRN